MLSPEEDLNLGRVGRCIYCDAPDRLSDEHVIPHGLGSRAILYAASCKTCAGITSAFERVVLRDQFGAFRARLGLPTRRPSQRPTAWPARVRKGDTWEDVRLPLDRYMAVAPFPKLPMPGVIEGRPPGAPISFGAVAVTVVPKDGIGNDPPRRAGVDAIELNTPFPVPQFMRLLAKIALGFSVSLIGYDRLEPAVRGVILGTDRDAARWVGCPTEEWRVFQAPGPQSAPVVGAGPIGGALQVRVRDMTEVGGVVFVWVRLFGPQGAPEYLVVVGRTRYPAPDAA